MTLQELTNEMTELKSQAHEKSSPPRVWFAPTPQVPPQYQQHPYQQQPQHQQQQQAQQMYGGQPALMWDLNMTPGDGRQSWPAPPQTAGTKPGEAAAAVQLPQLLQKLQKTQEKLESRDASARKYKVSFLQPSSEHGIAHQQTRAQCQVAYILKCYALV